MESDNFNWDRERELERLQLDPEEQEEFDESYWDYIDYEIDIMKEQEINELMEGR